MADAPTQYKVLKYITPAPQISTFRSWSGQISLQELRRSDLLDVLQFLDDEPNINKETKYFSYEHFYVVYTCFWKLDKDRDLSIDQVELSRHGDCGKRHADCGTCLRALMQASDA